MPYNTPDYSQYVSIKKISVAQTANTNSAVVKARAPNFFNGYFPLYRGIKLPSNALLSNKFLMLPAPTINPALPAPAQLNNLVLWLDGNDPNGDGSIVANNTNITTWYDKSGAGRDAVSQTTAAILKTNIQNSNSVVSFGGNSAYKVTYPSFPTPTCTIFAVTRLTNNSTSNRSFLFGPYGGNYGLHAGVSSDGQTIATYMGNASSAWNDTNGNSPAILNLNAWKIIGIVNSSNSLTPYVNGVSQTLKNGTTATFNDLNIGNGRAPWVGEIGEIIIYSRAISTVERVQIETYLSDKWNIK